MSSLTLTLLLTAALVACSQPRAGQSYQHVCWCVAAIDGGVEHIADVHLCAGADEAEERALALCPDAGGSEVQVACIYNAEVEGECR